MPPTDSQTPTDLPPFMPPTDSQASTDLPPFMGVAEIADYLGVTKGTIRYWTGFGRRGYFPDPYLVLKMGPLYHTHEITEFKKKHTFRSDPRRPERKTSLSSSPDPASDSYPTIVTESDTDTLPATPPRAAPGQPCPPP